MQALKSHVLSDSKEKKKKKTYQQEEEEEEGNIFVSLKKRIK